MLFSLIKSGDITTALISVCASIFVVFCTLPIHEYAHALVATKLGDDTARLKGRLTINPLAHIDPFGALMIIIAGFGWAKPVPVNMRNFKKPKLGMAITALAGPVSNLIMAFLFMILFFILGRFLMFGSDVSTFISLIFTFIFFAIRINVYLAVFNLLPIPPLDGSRLLTVIIPNKYYYKIMQYERYIMIALMALLIFGVLSVPLQFLSGYVMKTFAKIASLPFGAYGEVIFAEFFA